MLCFHCNFSSSCQSFVKRLNKCVFQIPTGEGFLTFCVVYLLKQEVLTVFLFPYLVLFEHWTVTLSYSTNSMRRLGIPLYIPNSLYTPVSVFILILLSYCLKFSIFLSLIAILGWLWQLPLHTCVILPTLFKPFQFSFFFNLLSDKRQCKFSPDGIKIFSLKTMKKGIQFTNILVPKLKIN